MAAGFRRFWLYPRRAWGYLKAKHAVYVATLIDIPALLIPTALIYMIATAIAGGLTILVGSFFMKFPSQGANEQAIYFHNQNVEAVLLIFVFAPLLFAI